MWKRYTPSRCIFVCIVLRGCVFIDTEKCIVADTIFRVFTPHMQIRELALTPEDYSTYAPYKFTPCPLPKVAISSHRPNLLHDKPAHCIHTLQHLNMVSKINIETDCNIKCELPTKGCWRVCSQFCSRRWSGHPEFFPTLWRSGGPRSPHRGGNTKRVCLCFGFSEHND